MKHIFLIVFFTIGTIIPVFSQVNTASSSDTLLKQGHDTTLQNKSHKFGFSMFGGLGLSGNNLVMTSAALGLSARAHYGIHTVNIYTSRANTLGYYGAESDNATLHASHYGVTYGPGYYSKYVAASIGVGLAYSYVRMTTGGGENYQEYYYQNFGACVGGQFSVHGKYVGFGIQAYYNITSPIANYSVLFGLELRISSFVYK